MQSTILRAVVLGCGLLGIAFSAGAVMGREST